MIINNATGLSLTPLEKWGALQDSLDTVDMIMAFEEAFGIAIPDDQAEKILTVQAAIDFIKSVRK